MRSIETRHYKLTCKSTCFWTDLANTLFLLYDVCMGTQEIDINTPTQRQRIYDYVSAWFHGIIMIFVNHYALEEV